MNMFFPLAKGKITIPLRSMFRYKDQLWVFDQCKVTSATNITLHISFPTIVLIDKGCLHARLDLKEMKLPAYSMLILMPNQLLDCMDASDDISCKIIVYHPTFTDKLHIKVSYDLQHSIRTTPAISLCQQAFEALQQYEKMLIGLLQHKENPYQIGALINLTRTYFYGAGYYLHMTDAKAEHSRKDAITNEFLALVEQHCNQNRQLSFYADKMCLSPKYIANSVKSSTGKSAREWITLYTIFKAKILLATPNLSITEVSNQLNFPNPSTFGKYFKKQTTLSPIEFRENLKSGI